MEKSGATKRKKEPEFNEFYKEDVREFIDKDLKSKTIYSSLLSHPLNPITSKPYCGLNASILYQWMRSKKTTIPFFATFQQWSTGNKYGIKKGAKGIKVMRIETVTIEDNSNHHHGTNNQRDSFEVPKWFSVFHASDVNGTEVLIDDFKNSIKKYHHPIRENIECFINALMKQNRISLVHDSTVLPSFNREEAKITVPEKSYHEDLDAYYNAVIGHLCQYFGEKVVPRKSWDKENLGKREQVIISFAKNLLLERFQVACFIGQDFVGVDWGNFGSHYVQLKGIKWAYEIANQMAKDYEDGFNKKSIIAFLICQRRLRWNQVSGNVNEPGISALLPREINMWIVSVAFPPVFFVPSRYMNPENFEKLNQKTKDKIKKKPKLN